MYRLIFMLTILALASCNNQNSRAEKPQQLPYNPQNTFATCFVDVDSSNTGQSVGCSGATYKLINDIYVVCINPAVPIRFDSCYHITIDSSNAGEIAKLLVFDKKNANLTNICTDIHTTNNPKPTRQLAAQSGQLIIGFGDPLTLYNNKTQHTTILIKRLLFVDTETGEKIELENEILWKVLDRGMSG